MKPIIFNLKSIMRVFFVFLLNTKKTSFTFMFFVGALCTVNAQCKIAHINVQQLLSEMPEMKEAQAELKKLEQTYTADIGASLKEFQNKSTLYRNKANSKTREENEERALELQGYEKNIQDAREVAFQEMQKRQNELFAPISDKAKAAIENVAAAQGFDYVIDASPGTGLIVAKGENLLSDVKKELGY